MSLVEIPTISLDAACSFPFHESQKSLKPLDYDVRQRGALANGQAIGINKDAGTTDLGGKYVHSLDGDAGGQRRPAIDGIGQIPHSRTGMRSLEIDDTGHFAIVQDDIVRSKIPVADDLARRAGRQLPV